MKWFFTYSILLFNIFVFALSATVFAQEKYTLSGTVLTERNTPIESAVVVLPQSDQWAVASNKGEFFIRNVAAGKIEVQISSLGYVPVTHELDIKRDSTGIRFYLKDDNLKIEDVVVTAKENANSSTTSRTINRTAMDHMQMVNVSDLMSLLPGGKTIDPNLASASPQRFEIRSGGEAGASFGTAVEVDGVRLSNNAAFDETAGASTRNLSSANIESVEVITGVPSVEHGDMTNGIVRIKNRQGASPWMITLSTNPKTKQLAATKGFNVGGGKWRYLKR